MSSPGRRPRRRWMVSMDPRRVCIAMNRNRTARRMRRWCPLIVVVVKWWCRAACPSPPVRVSASASVSSMVDSWSSVRMRWAVIVGGSRCVSPNTGHVCQQRRRCFETPITSANVRPPPRWQKFPCRRWRNRPLPWRSKSVPMLARHCRSARVLRMVVQWRSPAIRR